MIEFDGQSRTLGRDKLVALAPQRLNQDSSSLRGSWIFLLLLVSETYLKQEVYLLIVWSPLSTLKDHVADSLFHWLISRLYSCRAIFQISFHRGWYREPRYQTMDVRPLPLVAQLNCSNDSLHLSLSSKSCQSVPDRRCRNLWFYRKWTVPLCQPGCCRASNHDE